MAAAINPAPIGNSARPEARNVGVVFQEPRLFAHLNALDNVAFGLRARHVPRSEARRRAAHWLDRVGLGDVTGHRPRQMSGGQAQRVALARTLATEPAVLLLDEPLSAVDASARVQLRRVLRDELRRHPGARVIVTHDPIEAAALADQLLVLEGGHITQQGPLIEAAARPRSAWMATMVGLNLLEGMADGGAIALPGGETIMTPYSSTGPVSPHSGQARCRCIDSGPMAMRETPGPGKRPNSTQPATERASALRGLSRSSPRSRPLPSRNSTSLTADLSAPDSNQPTSTSTRHEGTRPPAPASPMFTPE